MKKVQLKIVSGNGAIPCSLSKKNSPSQNSFMEK